MAKRQNDDELISTGKRRKRKDSVPVNGVKVDLSVKKSPVNKYYMSVAGKYRAVRYVTVVMLVLFLTVMLIFFRENITYSNLMYLIRDLDTAGEIGGVGSYTNITYDGQYAEDFALFKGRVLVAGTSGLTVYDASGSKETEYDSDYSKPRLETGEKYALMYDCGGKSYSLFTSVARVLTSASDEVIEGAAVSDSGYYALLTRSKDSKYMVTVYNSGFEPVMKYHKDKYVIDTALDPDGKNIAVVSAFANGSSVSCEVSFAKVGTEDFTSVQYDGIMPLSAHYTGDGTMLLMCDTALMGFHDGELAWRHDFEGTHPNAFTLAGNTAAVCCSKNSIGSTNDILIFDIKGEVLYNIALERKITDIVSDGEDSVYAVGDGTGTRIALSDGTVTQESVSVIPVKLLSPAGSLIVCGEGGTASYFH